MLVQTTPTWRLNALRLAALGGVVGLVGTYWDDAWHTDRGRDSLLAPPHLVLYAGVFAAIVCVALLGRRPWSLGQRLAMGGGGAVLASAPVDELWHASFGRDAVLWSPPHMLAVVASLMLATGVLALVGERAEFSVRGPTVLLAAASVIGALQVPVLEFDSDVPQFPVWTYLPVAVTGWLLATILLRRLLPAGLSVVWACGAYTAVRVGIVLVLAGLDHSGSVVAPVLVLGILDEVLVRNHLSEAARLLVGALAAVSVWFLWLQQFGGAATSVPLGDLAAATAGALLGAIALLVLSGQTSWRMPGLAMGILLAIIAFAPGVVVAPSASAHDPGQGDAAQEAVLTVSRSAGPVVDIELTIDAASCTQIVPDGSSARRAGVRRVGVLDVVEECRYLGAVEIDQTGRWFVYVELSDRGRSLELWAPLARGEEEATVRRPLYTAAARPAPGIQVLAGTLLYGAAAAMLAVTLRQTERVRRARAIDPPRHP